jgi:DNA-binding LacI/PurR family transcriptional regulator
MSDNKLKGSRAISQTDLPCHRKSESVLKKKKQDADQSVTFTSLDVARKAGVSRAAVSYVLNGTRVEHVGEETRARILQAAEELGYFIHPSARALRTGLSDEICCIFHAPPTLVGDEISYAIQSHIFERGYVPVVYNGPRELNETWFRALKQMFARRPRGVIMCHFLDMTAEIALAHQMGVEHLVLLSTKAVPDIPTLLFPNMACGQLVVEHFLAEGHRRLGIIQPADTALEPLYQERLAGMRAALRARDDATLETFQLACKLERATEFVEHWLVRSERPTAIYAFDDTYALCLQAAFLDHQVRIPEEVALVGTGNLFVCEFARPALTSIASCDEKVLGQLAVEMLDRKMNHIEQPSDYPHTLPCYLIKRASG